MTLQTAFQRPAKVDLDEKTLSKTYGKFFAEPFERGFGTTIGNALRRVLLSSIPGAAVTSMKIEGVQHEFSTVSGMTEDVTDLILNIKQLRLKIYTDKPQLLRVKKKGPGELLAKEILVPSDVEILTPDLHLATLERDATLEMEMRAKIGRGYLPAEQNAEEGAPIGVIPIDAIFTPIRKVTVHVESARVGMRTDYDKLILEIVTDGSIRPEEALRVAGGVLKDHLAIFVHLEKSGTEEQTSLEPGDSPHQDLSKGVRDVELSTRALKCLETVGVQTLADLAQKTEEELLATKNFGVKSLNEIKDLLASMGLALRNPSRGAS